MESPDVVQSVEGTGEIGFTPFRSSDALRSELSDISILLYSQTRSFRHQSILNVYHEPILGSQSNTANSTAQNILNVLQPSLIPKMLLARIFLYTTFYILTIRWFLLSRASLLNILAMCQAVSTRQLLGVDIVTHWNMAITQSVVGHGRRILEKGAIIPYPISAIRKFART
jgi:hypothetical protein